MEIKRKHVAALLLLNLIALSVIIIMHWFPEALNYWSKMAVFLFCGTLTHFWGDLLSHKWRHGRWVFLHCLLYAPFFIPLFWWMGISFWWLLFVFFSHLTIDTVLQKPLAFLVRFFTHWQNEKGIERIAFSLDQVCHFTAVFVIALFVFL